MNFDIELATNIFPSLLRGAGVSLAVLFPCLLLGMAISVPIALWRLSPNPVIRGLAGAFSLFFRGVPAIVLLYMIYSGFATLPIVRETALWPVFEEAYYCAIIGLTLNHSGFLNELLRGAIKSVPEGLLEAAKSLGMTDFQRLILIRMPLAFRYALPAYQNEVTSFLKGTAVLGAITMVDLLAAANSAVSSTYDPLTPIVCAGAIYWSMVQMIGLGFARLERRLTRHLSSVGQPSRQAGS